MATFTKLSLERWETWAPLALHKLTISDNEIMISGSFLQSKNNWLPAPSSICYHVEIELSLVSSHEPCNLIDWNLNLSHLTSQYWKQGFRNGNVDKIHIRLGDMYLNVPCIYEGIINTETELSRLRNCIFTRVRYSFNVKKPNSWIAKKQLIFSTCMGVVWHLYFWDPNSCKICQKYTAYF